MDKKKRNARAKLLFCSSKPFAFLSFSLPSPSSLLKLPNKDTEGAKESVRIKQVELRENVRAYFHH